MDAGTSANGKSPFPASTPPLAWLDHEADAGKQAEKVSGKPSDVVEMQDPDEADTRPTTRQSRASVDQIQVELTGL